MKLSISRGKKVWDIEIDEKATVKDLKLEFEQVSKVSIYRQCFKLGGKDKTSTVLADDAEKLSSYGVSNDSELIFKDYGPQIGYRTVFIVEYLGPLLFVLFYSMRPSFIYGPQAAKMPFDSTAYLGVVAWTIHFLKRELETIFVHRFSRPTMPLFNLFKNSAYYWTFGLVVGYSLCHPQYTAPESSMQVYFGFVLFVVSELLNFCVHLKFRNMRAAEGSKERPMPEVSVVSQ